MSTPVGARVRFLREQRGWSQDHLAAVSGVSPRQIQRIESEESSPHKETLLGLASTFGLEVGQLSRGFSTDDLAEMEEQYMCPHCGALVAQRTFVPHEYGDCELEVFECGFTRGWSDRPAPPILAFRGSTTTTLFPKRKATVAGTVPPAERQERLDRSVCCLAQGGPRRKPRPGCARLWFVRNVGVPRPRNFSRRKSAHQCSGGSFSIQAHCRNLPSS